MLLAINHLINKYLKKQKLISKDIRIVFSLDKCQKVIKMVQAYWYLMMEEDIKDNFNKITKMVSEYKSVINLILDNGTEGKEMVSELF